MGAASVASERPTGMQRPDASGRFGRFGGKYVPETLITALAELEAAYAEVKNDPQFKARTFNLGVTAAPCMHEQPRHLISPVLDLPAWCCLLPKQRRVQPALHLMRSASK